MKQINSFFVKGERCSGTNYLEKLIEENLRVPLFKTPEWKHGYFSFGATDNFHREAIDYLTIFVFRNVFDWARSFYLMPHHLQGAREAHWEKQPTFSDFIRREVKLLDKFDIERNMDRHPYTLQNPKNIMQLRSWKIENWLNYKKLEKPAYYVKYEDLLKNPERIVREINDNWFGVDFTFENWKFYQKDETKEYEPKKYFGIPKYDLEFLLKNVDWSLEKKIGYNLKESLKTLRNDLPDRQ